MKIKTGIIGLGVGEAHIEGYLMHPECEVAAICDFNKKILKRIKKKYPWVDCYTKSEEIIKRKDIKILSIASYDNYHYEQIIQSIKNNKHLFAEKPLCQYPQQGKKILDLLLKNKNIKISSNLILRKCPRFQLIKKKIKDGELGKIYYIEGAYNYGRIEKLTKGWRGKIDFYSINLGGGVHIVDLLLWLSEKKITEVYTIGNNISTKNTKYKFNDLFLSTLQFENGINGKITSNGGCVYPHFHELNIYGTKATFKNDFKEGILYKSREPGYVPTKINALYPGVKKGDLIFDFVEAVISGKEPVIGKKVIFDALSVCFAIEKSIHTKNVEKVRYLIDD